MDDKPRQLHYTFAHRILPQLVLERWETLGPSFRDGSAPDRLRSMWAGLGKSLPSAEWIDADSSLNVRRVPLGNEAVFVIDLPVAEHPAEAALVVIPDRPASTRYFVLERGWDVVNRDWYWVLCEWDESGHVNYGACGVDRGTDAHAVLPVMLNRIADLGG